MSSWPEKPVKKGEPTKHVGRPLNKTLKEDPKSYFNIFDLKSTLK